MIIFMDSGKLLNQLHLLLLWFSVCVLITTRFSLGSGNLNVMCIESERKALLTFKKGLVDPANLLFSWTSKEEDCCKWSRVGCDNATGHVIMLDLHPEEVPEANGFSWQPMSGEIGPSLLELRYLSYLNLRRNSFNRIPDFIGLLDKLTHLDLSENEFRGTFPYQLGNLSMLQYLALGTNYGTMIADNFEWLTHLSSLKVLNMSGVNLVNAADWLRSIKMLPFLSALVMSNCQFPKFNPSYVTNINPSNSLAVLSFYDNAFNDTIYSWLFNVSAALVDLQIGNCQLGGSISESFGYLTSLEHLDLSYNQFEGWIPTTFRNLCRLKTLDLSYNYLSVPFDDILQNLKCSKNSLEDLQLSSNKLRGSIPDFTEFSSLRGLYLQGNQLDGSFPESFKNISRLRFLNVDENKLVGSLPDFSKLPSLIEFHAANNELNGSLSESLGKLSNLSVLVLSSNKLNGLIAEHKLSALNKLQQLDLSYNSLAFNVSFDWVPSFQLDVINLGFCMLGPFFPNWLQTQTNFSHLDISNSNISDAIPSWFWNFPSRLQFLNLSFNHLYDQVPNLSLKLYNYPAVDLSSNLFYGPIPPFLSNSTVLKLSNNKFSGNLSFLCLATDGVLSYLDLSNNLLSGDLTDCWFQFKMLKILNLENNNLYGKIPMSMGSLSQIQSLQLRNNSLTGELPVSLKNCTELKLLDLGENRLIGKLPTWLGECLGNLVVLRLPSNELHGKIPLTICHLSSLQLLDLSFNNLSGSIPVCINNLTAMALSDFSNMNVYIPYYFDFYRLGNGWSATLGSYIDYAVIRWKGIEQEYGKTLGLLKLIDLSRNKLIGGIPGEVTGLLGLISLNLSSNNLTGTIPIEIWQLKKLEVLDMSHNQLSGQIPSGLAEITFISKLDLSNNNLSGRIPTSTQLQSFSASAYLGNPGLCGLPLEKCPGDGKPQDPPPSTGGVENENGEEWLDRSSLYSALGIGFAVGFWAVCGPLLINNPWRRTYCQFLNKIADWLYVKISLMLAKF